MLLLSECPTKKGDKMDDTVADEEAGDVENEIEIEMEKNSREKMSTINCIKLAEITINYVNLG